ncbi:MAG: zinc-binding dehydrogenase, partial [Candidatus Eremiobacterota bacterium]
VGAEVVPEGKSLGEPDVVVECTGRPEVWERAVEEVGPGGTVLFYGGCPGGTTVRLPLDRVCHRNLTLLGAFHFTPAAVAEARELLLGGRIPCGELVTRVLPLEGYREAFDGLERGEAVKFCFEP